MPHPLLHLVASRPELLVEHAQGYVDLASAEVSAVSARWKRGALLSAAALCCLVAALVLVGVALMLWAAIPSVQMPAPWLLVVVPLPPLALALWCLLAARAPAAGGAFEQLRRQLNADMALLREVGAP